MFVLKLLIISIGIHIIWLFVLIGCFIFISLSVSANEGQVPKGCKSLQIYGILGVVRLLVGHYIIVIKEKRLVGKISGHDVWQLVEIDTIPLPKTKLHLNETQVNI